jgi:hypothetical protein
MTFSPLVIIGISISIVISVLFYNINEAEILAVRLETFKQADNHRGKMLGETKSVLPVITDKYKNADMGKCQDLSMHL